MPGDPFKQRFVLDTSMFLTDEIRGDDESLQEALLDLLDLIAEARLRLGISCYVPPTIHDELTTSRRGRGPASRGDRRRADRGPRAHDRRRPDRLGPAGQVP